MKIDYTDLLEKVNQMIGLLEYDGSRSAGKMKLNSQHLHSLYFLKEKYEAMLPKKSPSVKKEK